MSKFTNRTQAAAQAPATIGNLALKDAFEETMAKRAALKTMATLEEHLSSVNRDIEVDDAFVQYGNNESTADEQEEARDEAEIAIDDCLAEAGMSVVQEPSKTTNKEEDVKTVAAGARMDGNLDATTVLAAEQLETAVEDELEKATLATLSKIRLDLMSALHRDFSIPLPTAEKASDKVMPDIKKLVVRKAEQALPDYMRMPSQAKLENMVKCCLRSIKAQELDEELFNKAYEGMSFMWKSTEETVNSRQAFYTLTPQAQTWQRSCLRAYGQIVSNAAQLARGQNEAAEERLSEAFATFKVAATWLKAIKQVWDENGSGDAKELRLSLPHWVDQLRYQEENRVKYLRSRRQQPAQHEASVVEIQVQAANIVLPE